MELRKAIEQILDWAEEVDWQGDDAKAKARHFAEVHSALGAELEPKRHYVPCQVGNRWAVKREGS